MTRQPVIRVAAIRKTYGRTVAVDDVSFDVEPGEIFGLIGPNGAGKTTTMECVEGLRRPDRGTISVFGLDPVRHAYALQQRTGVQLQEAQLQKRIKVRDAVSLWASLYPNAVDGDRLIEQLGLRDKRDAWFMTIFVREPLGVIGTIGIPVALFVVFGRLLGPRLRSGSANVPRVLSSDLPIFASLLIATSAVLSLVTIVAIYREGGILKRLRATPLRPHTILTAHVMVKLLFSAVTLAVMVMAGRRYYPVDASVPLLSFALALLFSTVSVLSLGFVVASVVPTARFAQPIATVVFYPMLAISGLFMPVEAMPPVLQGLARILPLRYAVSLLRGIWQGEPWSLHVGDVAALVLMFVVCTAVSARVFRWEYQRGSSLSPAKRTEQRNQHNDDDRLRPAADDQELDQQSAGHRAREETGRNQRRSRDEQQHGSCALHCAREVAEPLSDPDRLEDAEPETAVRKFLETGVEKDRRERQAKDPVKHGSICGSRGRVRAQPR
jgi:ABC-2 type transport system permease protein